MSDKIVHSTENTQYYYEDGNGMQHNVDSFWLSDMPRFWCAIRSEDKVQVIVHYNKVRSRDLRFD
jgi:hypothetical protein